MRPAPLGRRADAGGKLEQPLHELSLLVGQRTRGRRIRHTDLRVAEDPGDARVRGLDVVDAVLLAPLRSEVDIDLDRLVVTAREEIPAGRVDADLVDEVVEKDDVAAALR